MKLSNTETRTMVSQISLLPKITTAVAGFYFNWPISCTDNPSGRVFKKHISWKRI